MARGQVDFSSPVWVVKVLSRIFNSTILFIGVKNNLIQSQLPQFQNYIRDFFLVFAGAEIRSHSQWNFGDFFPNFETKNLFF